MKIRGSDYRNKMSIVRFLNALDLHKIGLKVLKSVSE